MLTPQTEQVLPNALYASQIVLGSYISNGTLVGGINALTLNGATVDESGAWSPAIGTGSISGLSFVIDNEGNVTGLPEDLALIGPQIVEIWGRLVNVIEVINSVRKLI